MSEKEFASKIRASMEEAKQLSEDQKLYRYEGVLYPRAVCPEDNIRALDHITARPDDVMLAAYPKCGFNWMVGVLRKIIVEASGEDSYAKPAPPLIEFMGPDGIKAIEAEAVPRFLGTHLHPDNIPPSFYQQKTKMLVVFRNPKDTAVSYFHFSNKNPVLRGGQSWDAFYADFLSGDVAWGSYFQHAAAWDKKLDDPNVMLVTYEELKQDLSRGVRQIAAFFGFRLTEEQVLRIAGESTFSAMKESSAGSHGNMGNVFFRKGEVGDWKNHFTAEQSQQMDEAFTRSLAGTKLGAKLNYQLHCQ